MQLIIENAFVISFNANKKKLAAVFLSLIILLAIVVRTYHFEEWLYFKMDQARDALMIGNALENGPQYLPLLGPRAGATEVDSGYLRLGPAYYYMQYLTGLLPGATLPESNAFPDLFFSIAVLPLLYVFLRLYFSRFNALLVTAMYAFSFLIIEYSRFAWNPNPLPFFAILSFYALIRFFAETNKKKAMLWIALWSFALSVGMQLHFFGFFSLIGISGLMILWRWQVWNLATLKKMFTKNRLKAFAAFASVAMGIFLLVNSPFIISDVMRKGENSKNFVQALTSKPKKEPLSEKVSQNVSETFKYYCLLTTSECYKGEGFDKRNVSTSSAVMILLAAGLGIAAWQLVGKKEKSPVRKDFLFLVLTWFSVFFILSIPVASQIRPRFYIVVFAVPFILIAFVMRALQAKFGRNGLIASAILAAVIIGWNVKGTLAWFQEQKLAQNDDAIVQRTLILKTKDGVTLGQLQRAVDYMYSKHRDGAALYYYIKPEHVAPVKFLLFQKDHTLKFGTISKSAESDAQFFAITATGNELEAYVEKFGNNFTVLDQQRMGQITVTQLDIRGLQPKKESMFFNRNTGSSDRVFWKDVFGIPDKPSAIMIDGAE